MALFTCPDCQHTLSDRAPSCPRCGCPNGNLPPAEQTSKLFKLQQLLAFLICLAGITLFLFSLLDGSPVKLALAATVFTIGLIWLIVLHLLVWWYHK